MYLRKTTRTYKGKTYTNHLLVESVQTPNGPRQRTICSLGSLEPAPAEDWLALAHKLESALHGQECLRGPPPEVEHHSQKARNRKKRAARSASAIAVDPDRITMEEAREAGPVHAGHQMWRQLGIEAILQGAGLSERARRLTEAMTLNRLIYPLSEHAMPDWVRRIAMGFPKRMRSSTATSKIDRASRRCWTRWKNAWARNRARQSLWTGAWPTMRTWNRYRSAACTTWWRDCNRRETIGSMSWRTTMDGRKSCEHPRRGIHFRKRRALRSSASRREMSSTFSAAVKAVRKRTEPFERHTKQNWSET